MKRILPFILGMFFGIFVLFAGLGIAGYTFVTSTKIETYVPNSQALGNLSQLSILDFYNEISQLVAEENIANPNADGKYFSVADFEEKYGADLSAFLGVQLSDNVKEMPFFTLFTEEGVNKAMQQTSVAAALDLASLAGMAFSPEFVAEMQRHSLSELTGESPFDVFDNVPLKWVVAGFDSTESQIMTALGNSSIGAIIKGATNGNLLLSIKTDPKLKPLADIVLAEALSGAGEGETDLVANVLQDTTLGDLISDTGDFAFNSVLTDLYVGQLLSYSRQEYTATGSESAVVNGIVSNGENYYKLDKDVYYKATLDCDETHTHTADCYDFVWTHNSEAVSKLYAVLSNLKIDQLASGSFDITSLLGDITLGDVMGDSIDGSVFESLKDTTVADLPSEFETMTIGELLGDKIDGTPLEGFADCTITGLVDSLNDAPIGKFLGYEITVEVDVTGYTVIGKLAEHNGAYAKLVGTTWHDAYKLCSHTNLSECSNKCYTVWVDDATWVQGVNCLLSDKTLKDISQNGINGLIDELTLRDVLGDDVESNDILKALADEPIGNIASKVNTLTLRQVLGSQVDSNKVLKLLADKTITEIPSALDELYLGQVLGYTRNSTNDGWTETLTGVTKTIADIKIKDLSQDTISTAVNQLSLRDVMGDNVNTNNVLKAIADTPISNVPDEINKLPLGVVLNLEKRADNKWYDIGTNQLASPFDQKIAELQINELDATTIAEVVHDLSIKDLIESDMVTLEDDTVTAIDSDLLLRDQNDTATFRSEYGHYHSGANGAYVSGDWQNYDIEDLINAVLGWTYVPGM